MASRYEVELTISSARDLKNVNWRHGPLIPYAVVWIDPNNKSTTKVDEYGDTCPNWDHTHVIPVPHRIIHDDTTLYIDIVHAGREEDTKPLIGSARLKLIDVIDDVGVGERVKRTLQLKRPSGRPQGKTDVKVTVKQPNATVYGVPPPPAAYGNPYGAPPVQQNPYYAAAAPPSGYPSGVYNAPPQYGQPSYGQVAYGQQQQQQQQGGGFVHEENKKSKFGGMGTGLAVGAVAGVLGGIAIAEGVDALEDNIADDVADDVEDDLGW